MHNNLRPLHLRHQDHQEEGGGWRQDQVQDSSLESLACIRGVRGQATPGGQGACEDGPVHPQVLPGRKAR